MSEPPARPGVRSDADEDPTGPHDSDLVPDAVEDVARDLADSARTVGSRASQTARTVATVTGQVKGQASGQLVELGHAAREDDARHWRALAACILAVVATAIDPPVLQATSSGVQGALRIEPEGAAQLVGLYYMIQAGAMVAGGVLGDMFGLRRVLSLGMVAMLGSALVMATAPSAVVLVIGSVGLSLSTAVVVPLSLAGVMQTFGRRVMPVAIALYLSIQLVAALLGPAMAQLLFDRFGFGATLVPAMAVTIVALVAVRRWLQETVAAARVRGVDALSLILWSVGMLTLIYGTVAFAAGWGPEHLAAIIAGILCLLAAAARFARGRTRIHLPDVPFRVIGVTLFLGATLGLVQSGSLLQLSNFLKGVQDYGDIGSGLALAPFALATLVASMVTGVALVRRYHGEAIDMRVFRRPMAVGFAVVSASAMLMGALQEDSGYLLVGTALGLLGAGAGIANVPRTDLLFRAVRQDRIGIAAGLNGSSFLLGEALGNISVTVMIALTSAVAWQQRLVDAGMTTTQAEEAYEAAQRAVFLATAHPFAQPSHLDVAQQVPGWAEIFTSGFTAAMLVLAAISVVAVVVAIVGLRDASDPKVQASSAAA
jgi:MFS transporter, DHA2 family, multidrug resistance protein